ncbi:hypothetical protein Tco_0364984 [Tanacetum coccineum]
MSTYLKHIGGYTYKQLKGKSFDEIQKLFDKERKRVNTFVAMGSEVQESKEQKEEGREETAKGSRKKLLGRKRVEKEQQKGSSKKQKVEEEKESDEVDEVDEAELKKLLVIKNDEDIAIDAIPLATKLPVIIDYKLHKEGMLVHYQLIRADESSKRYSLMIRMLQGIDKEDLEALWRIVKEKYDDTRPDNEFERVLRNLKIQKMNIKFRGGLLGLKRLHGFLEVTVAQDLEQIHEDDLEAMDLKWQLRLLCGENQRSTIRGQARRFSLMLMILAGYDKTKVECLQLSKSWGHFARECRAPRSKDWSSSKSKTTPEARKQ